MSTTIAKLPKSEIWHISKIGNLPFSLSK